ncbi:MULTISPECIES: hypothetical protein [unclassified Streptomyces]|uniref:Uncharacterized protein n=1 Tax=Streptomyces sp. NBC_00119 TaxID=2975659 RepID=A0AAU1UEB6_9ACTN|nr:MULTISPECIES: hypothetical protein [unclassified Streptomyces]MCX4645136.1 hypothetical protein [Streptomyces sp. NBC_01446]MCX5326094.1 hypothetical protein [Streptomyces sp. NBC_00120]
MAEAADKGGGSDGSPWAFFGVLGAVGAAQAAVGEVVTELESFTKFQERVDQLVKDLKGSPAGPQKVGQEVLARQQFGGGDGGFKEASGLHSSYSTVISELENLSKLLSDSIEGMGIAVMASHKGYANIDDDIRRRMQAISAETTRHYGGEYEPPTHKNSDDGSTGGSGKGGTDSPADGSSGGDTGGAI